MATLEKAEQLEERLVMSSTQEGVQATLRLTTESTKRLVQSTGSVMKGAGHVAWGAGVAAQRGISDSLREMAEGIRERAHEKKWGSEIPLEDFAETVDGKREVVSLEDNELVEEVRQELRKHNVTFAVEQDDQDRFYLHVRGNDANLIAHAIDRAQERLDARRLEQEPTLDEEQEPTVDGEQEPSWESRDHLEADRDAEQDLANQLHEKLSSDFASEADQLPAVQRLDSPMALTGPGSVQIYNTDGAGAPEAVTLRVNVTEQRAGDWQFETDNGQKLTVADVSAHLGRPEGDVRAAAEAVAPLVSDHAEEHRTLIDRRETVDLRNDELKEWDLRDATDRASAEQTLSSREEEYLNERRENLQSPEGGELELSDGERAALAEALTEHGDYLTSGTEDLDTRERAAELQADPTYAYNSDLFDQEIEREEAHIARLQQDAAEMAQPFHDLASQVEQSGRLDLADPQQRSLASQALENHIDAARDGVSVDPALERVTGKLAGTTTPQRQDPQHQAKVERSTKPEHDTPKKERPKLANRREEGKASLRDKIGKLSENLQQRAAAGALTHDRGLEARKKGPTR